MATRTPLHTTLAAATLATAVAQVAAVSLAGFAVAHGTPSALRCAGHGGAAGLVADVRTEAPLVRSEAAPAPGVLSRETTVTRAVGDEPAAVTAPGDRVTPAPTPQRARGPPSGREERRDL